LNLLFVTEFSCAYPFPRFPKTFFLGIRANPIVMYNSTHSLFFFFNLPIFIRLCFLRILFFCFFVTKPRLCTIISNREAVFRNTKISVAGIKKTSHYYNVRFSNSYSRSDTLFSVHVRTTYHVINESRGHKLKKKKKRNTYTYTYSN